MHWEAAQAQTVADGRAVAAVAHAARPAEQLAAIAALAALLAASANGMLPVTGEQEAEARRGSSALASRLMPPTERETFVGAYTGAPYTYPSTVHFEKPGADLTIHDVAWDGRPFDDPIYYGARWARWSRTSSLGHMVDFTHSKVYSQREQRVTLSGRRGGEPVPGAARMGDLFHHFEFTHGHNMLTLNALYRLPWRTAHFSPYVGIGAGLSIPHTEVQFKGEAARTYAYQLTGPVLQVVAGLEIRVPRLSYFIEYKFTLAPYLAPLHVGDGGTAFGDLWQQLVRWWGGRPPEGGWLRTRLTSHQVIAGLGVRSGNALAARP